MKIDTLIAVPIYISRDHMYEFTLDPGIGHAHIAQFQSAKRKKEHVHVYVVQCFHTIVIIIIPKKSKIWLIIVCMYWVSVCSTHLHFYNQIRLPFCAEF